METRRYYISKNIKWLEAKDKWVGLKSIGMVISERQEKDKEASIEKRYFICSTDDDPKLLAKAVRSLWGIENSLHWVLDVVFQEDKGRTRKDYGAENLSAIRRYVISRIKQCPEFANESIRGRRKLAQWDRNFAMKLIFSEQDGE